MVKSALLLAGVPLLVLSLGAGAAEHCRYSAPRNAELDAVGLKQLTVQIGPDELVLHGDPGATKVEVRGTACASNEKWLQEIQVEAVRQGDGATVTAHDRDHGIHLSLFGDSYAYLKLDVTVPQSLAVTLKEGSGDAAVHHVAALDATVGSGDLKADAIAGELGLVVGSGDAVANHVGSLKLSSVGSGDVSVDGVQADARVGSVGSGDLALRNVTGGVTIDSIASGDATLANVGGSVKVGSVGSGDLVVRGVKGDVAVGSVSSGDVSIERAGGSVRADSVGSGSFGALDVGGDFSVGSVGSGDIRHRDVKGKVSVPQRHD